MTARDKNGKKISIGDIVQTSTAKIGKCTSVWERNGIVYVTLDILGSVTTVFYVPKSLRLLSRDESYLAFLES